MFTGYEAIFIAFGRCLFVIAVVRCSENQYIIYSTMNTTDTIFGTTVEYTLAPGFYIDGETSVYSTCTGEGYWLPEYPNFPNSANIKKIQL